MNILFVHEISYLRDPIFEFHTLADLLSLRGHNIYAIDYGREQGSGLVSGYQEMDIARAYPDAKVHLIRPPFLKIPVVGRLVYGLSIYFVYVKVLREKKIDAVILYSAPTNGVQTILAAKKLGIPVMFRSIDVLHQLVKNPVLSKITRQIEKWVYKRVDRSLCITPALKRYIVDLGGSQGHCDVLPLGVDTSIFHPMEEDKELRRRLGFGDKDNVIVFVGTLPRFSGLDILIQQFSGMVRAFPALRLLIVGDGEQRPELESLICELGLEDKVKITGMVPHDDVPRYINLAWVCVNTFPVSDITRDIFPTKVLLYMACGKPVVSTPLDGLKDMGIGENQGVLYTKGDFLSTMRASRLNPPLGELALRYTVENHSYDKVIDQLETELATLTGDTCALCNRVTIATGKDKLLYEDNLCYIVDNGNTDLTKGEETYIFSRRITLMLNKHAAIVNGGLSELLTTTLRRTMQELGIPADEYEIYKTMNTYPGHYHIHAYVYPAISIVRRAND